jgi:prophage regulatory protein
MDTLQTFLRRPEVERVTGLPTSTLYDLMSSGRFPRPVKLSANRVGWIESEVIGWQQQRIAERGV